jgi:DNA-binding transcriptional regulator YdaS (Cro superfamily)
MKDYKVTNIKGDVRLQCGGKNLSLAEVLDAHIENQTHTAKAAGIDRLSVNCACRGTRQLGAEKFLKILAAIGATITLPDQRP